MLVDHELLDTWLWEENRMLSAFEAMVDLRSIDSARTGGVTMTVRELADRWKWSRSKVSRFLDRAEESGFIHRRKEAGKTIIDTALDAGESSVVVGMPRPQSPTRSAPPQQQEIRLEQPSRKSPISLKAARSQAAVYGLTPDQGEFWWHKREAQGWLKGTSGGAAVAIRSPLSDMAGSVAWIREEHAKAQKGNQQGTKYESCL